MAVSIDYVGNRGRDNTGVIDINEGPVDADRPSDASAAWPRSTRPARWCRPPARNTTFAQFNQEQTRELGNALNSDFNSLELELEKRMSNRWSGRVSYTYALCHDVANIVVDSDPQPRLRALRSRQHARVRDERQRRSRPWPRRRDGVPHLFGLSDQRDGRHRRQRRRHEQRSSAEGRQRPHAADSLGARFPRLRRSQRDRRRAQDDPRRPVPVRAADGHGTRQASSWRSTT